MPCANKGRAWPRRTGSENAAGVSWDVAEARQAATGEGLGGFRTSMRSWLSLGGLVALEQMYGRKQGANLSGDNRL